MRIFAVNVIYLLFIISSYILIIFIALFVLEHWNRIQNTSWPRGDSKLRRRYQSTDMISSRPSYIGCMMIERI